MLRCAAPTKWRWSTFSTCRNSFKNRHPPGIACTAVNYEYNFACFSKSLLFYHSALLLPSPHAPSILDSNNARRRSRRLHRTILPQPRVQRVDTSFSRAPQRGGRARGVQASFTRSRSAQRNVLVSKIEFGSPNMKMPFYQKNW